MMVIIYMFSKTNEKGGKLIIPQLRSRQHSKGRVNKKELDECNDYQTDHKKHLNQSNQSLQEMKEVISNCNNCRTKLSQFVTKKPIHNQQRATQTVHKPFLIDLVEERVENICRQNTKLSRMLEEREEQLLERQNEINQIQDKFTGILLSMSQEIAFRRRKAAEWFETRSGMTSDTDTPSYIKALRMDP